MTTATVILRVNDEIYSSIETGSGPVNALDKRLRQCLATVYPAITNVRLTDYKVRVLDSKVGTAAKVRVHVEWSDHRRSWATVGVSENVIEASWDALTSALRLESMRLSDKDQTIERAVDGLICWGGVWKTASRTSIAGPQAATVLSQNKKRMRYFFTRAHPPTQRVLLVESGPATYWSACCPRWIATTAGLGKSIC